MTSKDLYKKAIELIEQEKPFAFAAVIHSAGSTPQKAGADALIEAAGPIWGTLGGGCLEAESRQRALLSLDDERAMAFDLKLDEVAGWDDALICGGNVRIFVNPSARDNLEVYREMIRAGECEENGILTTVVEHPDHRPGTAFWIPEAEISSHPLLRGLKEAQDHFVEDEAGSVRDEGASVELYIEPFVTPLRMLIAGAGHIGKAMAHQGKLLGFEVTVIDDRPAFANPDHIPDADRTICGDIARELKEIEITPNTYILIVTRGHRHDGAVLASCIHSPAAYIGMIGSRRKSLMIRRGLIDEGIATADQVNRVVSPIGLEIGARSVAEIAVSIAAQIVAFRRHGKLSAEAKNFVRKDDQRHHTRGGGIPADGTPETAAPLRQGDRH